MREKFIEWFQRNFPGTPLNGPTEAGEFNTWSAGYVAGIDRALVILSRKNDELEGAELTNSLRFQKEILCD